MKEMKEILVCTVPFIVAALLVYPFVAIIGGNTDPFMWERNDGMFFFICTITFGIGLLFRVLYVREGEHGSR